MQVIYNTSAGEDEAVAFWVNATNANKEPTASDVTAEDYIQERFRRALATEVQKYEASEAQNVAEKYRNASPSNKAAVDAILR